MKKITLYFIILLVSGCSGYFSPQGSNGNELVHTLAIENNGGYLSGPSNDITPFLYRDTNGNNPVLFFSSDRDGTYDIYYARMNIDGSFQIPVKMGTSINYSDADEILPLVGFIDDGNGMALPIITFVRNISNIVTASINPDFSINSTTFPYYMGYPVSGLIYSSTNIFANLWVYNENLARVYSVNSYFGSWDLMYGSYLTDPVLTNSYSGINVNKSLASYWNERVYILEKKLFGNKQISISYEYEAYNPYRQIKKVDTPNEYASSYNDRWPFVDFGGNGEVYFASDRGDSGDYDLFRYNTLNFYEVVPQNPFK